MFSFRLNHPVQRCRRALVLAGVALFAPAGAAEPDGLAPIRHAVSELIRKEMRDQNIPGLSLALIENQKILWAEGFGEADRERRVPARADTVYVIGELSQAFTASAILQLAEHGTLELDQPVKQLLPEFSMRSRFTGSGPITVRQLLTHHAGLPAMHFRDMWAPKPEALDSFIGRLKDLYVAFPPGHVFSPSLPGYDVLGRILEKQCGQAFAVCMQERLFAPLGMTHSTFDRSKTGQLAMHYWKDKPIANQTVRDVPAVGMASSVTDLARFMKMLLAHGQVDGKPLLKARSVQEMLHPQNSQVALDLDNRVGMPWRLSGVHFPQARQVAWINNQSPFSRGRMLLAPEPRLGVVVLTNSSKSSNAVRKVSERLMELVLQQRYPQVRVEPLQAVVAKPAVAVARADLAGHYATTLGHIRVTEDEHHIHADMLGKYFKLTPESDNLLSAEYRLLSLIPIPFSILKEVRVTPGRIAGRDVAIAYYRHQAYRLGEKIKPVQLSGAWLRRLGTWRAVERDALLKLVNLNEVQLAYTDGILHFRYRVPGWLGLVASVPVRPVSDTELVVEGTGWLMGETVQAVPDGKPGGKKEILRYSGYEFRHAAAP